MDGPQSADVQRELTAHYDAIRGELSSMVGCPHLAADFAQETYYRALRALERRDRPRDLRLWLRAIARNVARDHFRRARPCLPPECADELAPLDVDELALVAEREEVASNAQALADALLALPMRTRALVVGFYLEQKGCDELSRELGVRRQTMKLRLHRARAAVRKHLSERAGDSHG